MTTLDQVLAELAKVPESRYTAYHYEQCVQNWSEWVTSNDPNKLRMMESHEQEAALNCQFYLAQFLGLEPANQADLYGRIACLWTLARLLAVRKYIHQFRFFAALTSERFAYVTNGHKVNMDAYHVFFSDSTSPTGVVKEIGGPKDNEYAALITAAKRRTSTSRSFA